MQTSESRGAAGPDEAAVQAVFDEIAREEGMPPCQVCDPIGEGRVYYDGGKWLTANFDAATEKVYFQVLGGSGRSGTKEGDRFVVEIVATLRERFPGLDVVADVVGHDAEERRFGWPVSFTIHLAADTLEVAAAESAKRTLSQIVEETVSEHGLKIDRSSLVYYAGKRMSHTSQDRELALMVGYDNHATLRISLTRLSDEYESLQRALTMDLEKRLDAAFGADHVEVTGSAAD